MAAVLTGTQQHVASTSNASSSSLTIPADCTAVVILWRAWESITGLNMTSMTINSVAMTIVVNLAQNGDAAATGGAILVNPSTGTQTFAWDWSGTNSMSDGASFGVFYLKDLNTADPVQDSDTLSAIDNDDGLVRSFVLTTNATDFIVGMAGEYGTGSVNGAPSGSGQTVILDDQVSQNQRTDLFTEPGQATSTTVSMQGQYGSLVAIAIKAGAAGGSTFPPVPRPFTSMHSLITQ